MQKLLLLLALFCGFAKAQDNGFEREFSKFDKDFERLNNWKAETPASKKLKRAPAPAAAAPAAEPAVTPLDDGTTTAKQPAEPSEESAKPLQTSSATKKLPKGAKVEKLARSDLLGNQISDPEVRKKVQELYQRPDVVVQQYVLPTN